MKHFVLLLPFVFSLNTLSATHIIGGSISYEYLGNDYYKIRLEVLRDCLFGNPNVLFDDPASIGIYDMHGNLFDELLVPFTGDDTVSFDQVCVFSPGVCVHKAIYVDTLWLPLLDGGYTIAYQRCCRSAIISNLQDPLNMGMTFHTHLDPADHNTSPVFNKDFPFAVFTNTPFVYDASATDPDGDSLAYELIAPFAGGDQINNMPQPPLPPPYSSGAFKAPFSVDNMLGGHYALNIDSITGEMTAIPSITGFFQIAYAVREYRGGLQIGVTYREFAFVVILPAPGLNFDISGSVLINEFIPLDQGKVQIFHRDISTDSLILYEEQEIGPSATYSFENIPAGVFYIKAIVDTASLYYDVYLPTYYNSAAFWYEATPINQCDTSQFYRDIHLILADTVDGLTILDGKVNYAGRSFTPVAGLNLLLANEIGVPIQARTTNDEGYFSFEKLIPGQYLLFADLINSPIYNAHAPEIDLSLNTFIPVFLYEDSLSLQMPTSVHPGEAYHSSFVHVYPNPAMEKIIIEVKETGREIVWCELLDINGNFIGAYPLQSNQTESLSLSHLASGIYILKMNYGFHVEAIRIVKN